MFLHLQYHSAPNEYRRAPSLSYSEAACSWSSSHNEAGSNHRAPPPSAALLTAVSPWNSHRHVAPVSEQPFGYQYTGTPPLNVNYPVHHQQPQLSSRHKMMTVIPSSQLTSPSSSHHHHLHHAIRPYHNSRRPGTPGSATGCAGGRSTTPKPSPTPSLLADNYGCGPHQQPSLTSYAGHGGGEWVMAGNSNQFGAVHDGGQALGRRTSSGTDRTSSSHGVNCPAWMTIGRPTGDPLTYGDDPLFINTSRYQV